MIVNPATAKSLSYVIPPSVLNRADEVIERPPLAEADVPAWQWGVRFAPQNGATEARAL